MRIVSITAGAGGTICGNCLRDNALAAALRRIGHDVVLLPVYTPIRTDERDVSDPHVYLGGVNIYLQSKYPLFRKIPRAFDRIFDNPGLLRWVSKFAVRTQPEDLGALTVATIAGEDGPLRKEVARLTDAVKQLRPEIVHLTNSMLSGLAPALERELGVPVVCSLQGEDVFLDGLPEPFRTDAYALFKRMAPSVSRFIAPCRDHAATLAPRLGVPVDGIAVVPPGISVEGFTPRSDARGDEFVVGFLARIAPGKGLDVLIEAVSGLQGEPRPKLRAAGWVSPEFEQYFADLQRQADRLGLGERFDLRRYIRRDEKIELLRSLDAFSVPATYGASKGLYVLEAWAAAVPVVESRIGVFPELLEIGGGGLLVAPGDSAALGEALDQLRRDPALALDLGRRGREAVQREFTAERMAERTAAVYGSLLAGSSSAAS